MENNRSYRRRGTPELPMSTYLIKAGVDMHLSTHYHPEIQLDLVISGDVTMQVGGTRQTFSEGDIYIIPSNTVHGPRRFTEDASIRRLMFFPEAICMLPEHFFQREFVTPLAEGRLVMPSVLTQEHPAYEAVRSQMLQLQKHRIYEPNYKLGRFSALMNICMALMPYCTIITGEHPVPDPGNEAVKLCMRYIHNHYFKKLTLDTLAQKSHLHPNYLCAVFKTYTGQTVFEYINRYRIEIASELLRKEDLPVSKIAEVTGFRSDSLFYQKFKEYMGMPPKAYRKQHKKEL